MTTEKVALVWIHYCNGLGMFRSACEVLDTPDPQTKVFRFKEGCEWGMWDGSKNPSDVRKIVLYSSWSEFEVGQREGQYRVTRALELLPGSVAVLEGTTRPEAVTHSAPVAGAAGEVGEARCEMAIMEALESEPRMTLRTLKRKVHADRFPAFDACLERLAGQGELAIEEDTRMFSKRTWVTLTSVGTTDHITVTKGSSDSDVFEQ